jgi:hypothetical protein
MSGKEHRCPYCSEQLHLNTFTLRGNWHRLKSSWKGVTH